jgi:hypothetical protein
METEHCLEKLKRMNNVQYNINVSCYKNFSFETNHNFFGVSIVNVFKTWDIRAL